MKKSLIFIAMLCLISCFSFAQQETVDLANLEGKTLEELRLMRNEIFARHGRPFKTHELHTYFESQDWYKLNLRYTDSLLTKTEVDAAATILKHEQKLLKNNFITVDGEQRINFDNIINRRQFGEFSDNDIEKLCKNGFLVAPAKHEQFFYLYEDNDYKGIASFVTTDAVLQLYHIFFDFTLRNMEQEMLFPILITLNTEMLRLSQKLYSETDNEKIREAALRNIMFFTVPQYFLTGDASVYDPLVTETVTKEIERCEGHASRAFSLIFNPAQEYQLDHALEYTQFKIRGHYTRTDELERFFMAMMWHGLNYFLAGRDTDLIQSLIITKQLYYNRLGDDRLIDLWEIIYEPTVFYVGLSDDLGPPEYKLVVDEVFGDNPDYVDFTNQAKLQEAKTIAVKLAEKTRILPVIAGGSSAAQFRFMGQRYIPDSEMLQRLSDFNARPFPKGLDIQAVLGSQLAKKILLDEYNEGENWSAYPLKLDTLIAEFAELTSSDWKQNLYYSWIWCLKSIIKLSKEFTYPFFMQNEAWGRKSLTTSLASWAELRHDTILYGKQSGAECGNGGYWFPDPPKAFVEPNVLFYRRLHELLTFTHDGLQQRDLITNRMEQKFRRFKELVSFLEQVSTKELHGETLTKQEYDQIKIFGALLENLTTSIITDDNLHDWYEIISDVDKNIAVVADVHTSTVRVLEEGVGPAFEIFVVVEINGYLKLTRGAVFSYYEFTHPAADRLTDKKWQQIIKDGKEPPLPMWTKPYLSDQPSHEVPRPRHTYFTGC